MKQLKSVKSFILTPPPTYLNKEIQEEFRKELEKFYFDETKYDTYLEQLGVKYPTLK